MRKMLVAPFAGILLLTGCSGSPFNVLSDDQRIELRDGASDYQQKVLRDLVVDESEYRQAAGDWRDCVQESGAEPSELTANGNQLTFNYSVEAATEADAAAISGVADACLTEYFDAIGRVWASQDIDLS